MTRSIMAYAPGSHVAGVGSTVIIPDFVNNRMFAAYAPVTLAAQGITQFTGYVSGDVTAAKLVGELGVSNIGDTPLCLAYNGNLLALVFPSSNYCQLLQLRAADLKFISTAYIAGAGSPGLESSATLVPARYGRTDFVISTPGAINRGDVFVLSVPGLGSLPPGASSNDAQPVGRTDEVSAAAVLGPGAVGSNSGTAYVLGRGTNVFGIYKVTVSPAGPTMAKLATFHPADIDPAWTSIASMDGIAYDQTDGNIIIGVQGGTSAADQYVCKLSGATGALIWKLAINYSTSFSGQLWAMSSIKNGRFYCWGVGVGFSLFSINTIAGTFTQQTVSEMNMFAPGVSEDTNDSITGYGTWTHSATATNYLGTYMGTLGNHDYTGWLRLFPNGPTAPLPPAPPPIPASPPVVSVNRSWSYVLDGHTFYVLDLGAQGTFVYDQVTNQWSEFVTGTPATNGGPNLQWNMQNGCMWGTRIVGADLATSNIWEMAPGAVLDNDATQIAHVCTGGIPARSRTYVTCDAVRVSASFGYLDSAGTVSFNLRYSDDQENTWSSYRSVTLTPGNYGAEIAWRSLGAFASPGRVFELSDVGGLIRIDGADAYLDGFDDKPAGPGDGQP